MPQATNSKNTGKILGAFMVPGLAHLSARVKGDYESSWWELKDAYKHAGLQAQALEPDVYIIYSAQWISVLGHSVQCDPNPKGLHVDENWYDFCDFPFSMSVDTDLAKSIADEIKNCGLASKEVDFEGFPIDTGSIVTQEYFNPEAKTKVVILSSNIYANHDDTQKLGRATRKAIIESGKTAVLINCSLLSNRYFTYDIKPSEDKISCAEQNQWNQRVLELMAEGKFSELDKILDDYVLHGQPEMMFKGYSWLRSALADDRLATKVISYGPVWGTGAAVVEHILLN